ncbi:MAG: DNA repair protein RadA [Gammaproteobacteria bacterium]
MKSQKLVYQCTKCGAQSAKWVGQCADCGAWNSLVEDIPVVQPVGRSVRFAGYAGEKSGVQSIADISPETEVKYNTGYNEFDRVLGGGLVQGSVVLVGGDPGIGKSTLLHQIITAVDQKLSTLYVTGEESLQQVSLRANRLGLTSGTIRLLAETNVEKIVELASKEKPNVMVVDSIQTVFTQELQAAPGAVSQVRESAAQLVQFAKMSGTVLFLVGHVTKEGTLAGPRVLEHMVDTVLYFEGDTSSRYRVIRAVKNRFGAVNEVGIFGMTDKGLKEISNPSAIFVSRHDCAMPGSVVMVTREGSRPLLVEVQALVAESHMPNPRRVTVGLDNNRLAMLLAVLQRHCGIAMYDQDVFVNVAGGVRVTETAADLPIVLACLSSLRNQPLEDDLIVFGEIGLSGEIRPVQNGQERIKEAVQHGYKRAIIPSSNVPRKPLPDIEVLGADRLEQALSFIS